LTVTGERTYAINNENKPRQEDTIICQNKSVNYAIKERSVTYAIKERSVTYAFRREV